MTRGADLTQANALPEALAGVRLWILIVNYRTAALTIDCLRSIEPELPLLPGCRVLVIDNASGDGSAERIDAAIAASGWVAWAAVHRSDSNGGFAAGNNIGLRQALADPLAGYVLLLNPDTIVLPGALPTLLNFAAARPHIGIVGSRIENADGGVECSAHRDPSPLGELEETANVGVLSRLIASRRVSPPPREVPHACDWVSGAAFLVRRAVFADIGLLDEAYFLYYEEVDFCRRARSAGWACWHVPQSRIVHLEGAATGLAELGRRRPAYWFDSRRRFFVKTYGIGGLFAADVCLTLGVVCRLLRDVLMLGRGAVTRPKSYLSDLLGGDLRWLVAGARLRPPRVSANEHEAG